MVVAVPPKLMSIEEFLALPDDGVERWLVRGELRENGMTVRNRFHGRVTVRASRFLDEWCDTLPQPHGSVYAGEIGICLGRDPDLLFGVDVVYVSADVIARQTEEITIIDGVPVLAVEILSPNDTIESIHEKITDYLKAGIQVIWIIDPYLRTVEVFRQEEGPTLFNDQQELIGGTELPGFRVAVAKLFQ